MALERQIYVISDLHLGGSWPGENPAFPRGFRMMTHPDVLARFISGLAARTGGTVIELVINGDFVDFLAEAHGETERWTPFLADPGEALATFMRVAERAGDREVFDALRDFIAAGHALTVLLGNHDLELSLPAVRRAFEERVGAVGARSIRFLYDGEAYTVGEALIEHGNRYDPPNRVDHGGLRQLRSLQSRGQFEEMGGRFSAPAGSQLVARVMNPLKSDFAFIDLLKPESEPLFALVLALDPGHAETVRKIARAVPIGRAYGTAIGESSALPRFGAEVGGMSSTSDTVFHGDLAPEKSDVSDAALRRVLSAVLPSEAIDSLLRESSADVRFGADVGALERATAIWSLVRLAAAGNWVSANRRLALLRDTLPAIDREESFERKLEPAKRYLDAARALAKRHRFVVFGHTHHAKSVPVGDGLYLNSGTWANLMRFPADLFSSDEKVSMTAMRAFLEEVWQNRIEHYIEFSPTYVLLEVERGGRTHATLCDA